MKSLLLMITILSLTTAVSTTAYAASAIKGKVLYKKICQTCHIQAGEASVMGPADKKQEEWKTFFKEDQHSAKPEVWEKISKKKQKDLLLFFLNYSIDSEAPDECG
jgi:hypothetical protein